MTLPNRLTEAMRSFVALSPLDDLEPHDYATLEAAQAVMRDYLDAGSSQNVSDRPSAPRVPPYVESAATGHTAGMAAFRGSRVGDHYAGRWHVLDGVPLVVVAFAADGCMFSGAATTARWDEATGVLGVDPFTGLDIVGAEVLLFADLDGEPVAWVACARGGVSYAPSDVVTMPGGIVYEWRWNRRALTARGGGEERQGPGPAGA